MTGAAAAEDAAEAEAADAAPADGAAGMATGAGALLGDSGTRTARNHTSGGCMLSNNIMMSR